MDNPNRELELDRDQMVSMAETAMDYLIRFIESLPTQPASNVDNAEELAGSLIEPIPEAGSSFEHLVRQLFDEIIPVSFNTASPGYFAYVPGGGLFHAGIADLIADVTNRFTGIWAPAPGLVQLETNVIQWFCQLAGYPASAGGILTSGGSLANFSAIVTARAARLPERFQDGTIYASDQTHHSLIKSAVLAGFPRSQVRRIRTDDQLRLDLDGLSAQVQQDRDSGLIPFMVVGNAGTTNTGAIDSLDALADYAEQNQLWFHVDAAYGGFFLLTDQGKRVLRGIQRSDSIILDPHKGLFLPYGTGALLVKEISKLRQAHSLPAEYLPSMQQQSRFWDFSELSPELSRDYRGLRLWLPLKMHGFGPFRDNLDEKLQLTRWAAEQLRQIPAIELIAEPQLTIIAFQLRPGGESLEEANRGNRELLELINSRKRVYLSGTLVGGRFVLRICAISFRTHLENMQACIEDIRWATEQRGSQ